MEFLVSHRENRCVEFIYEGIYWKILENEDFGYVQMNRLISFPIWVMGGACNAPAPPMGVWSGKSPTAEFVNSFTLQSSFYIKNWVRRQILYFSVCQTFCLLICLSVCLFLWVFFSPPYFSITSLLCTVCALITGHCVFQYISRAYIGLHQDISSK